MNVLEVLDPGLLTTIQDGGRPGWAHVGVPPSGAVDRDAYAKANELVGNAAGSAVLEATLIGPTLRALETVTVAVVGARAPDHTRTLQPGDLLETRTTEGARSYVAVRGGIDVEPVLGSRSTDLLTGLGPRPLAMGDVLPVGPEPTSPPGAPQPGRPPAGPLRLHAGPRDDWFTREALELLQTAMWRVTTSANRVGIRLDGPPLERARHDELLSEGLIAGALQVPPSGRTILLLNDHPTTGGYPVIGVVASGDLSRAGQLKPGDEVRFALA